MLEYPGLRCKIRDVQVDFHNEEFLLASVSDRRKDIGKSSFFTHYYLINYPANQEI